MGVQGLWDLLAPAGRRVKINTLEGKVLAIDVSIWLIRMLHCSVSLGKNEFKNIHLVGILRRIIKLLYYGIKPVFIFDGKFPELKKETVHKRQMMREKRKKNLKKIAEKYLTKVLEQRQQSNSNRAPGGQEEEEEEENYFEDEKEREERLRKKEKEQKEKEENEDPEERDAMLYDFEFDLIVEENKELLIENGINLDEFYKQDNEKQYDVIKKVRDKMRDRKIKKYLAVIIENIDELSRVHINDYVKQCKRKINLEKSKAEAVAKKMSEDQENILGKPKFGELATNDYMKGLFFDPKKNVMQKTLASDRNKGFIYMVKNEKKYDSQVLKLGNKRQTKFERLRKLNKKLQEIAENAEVLPTCFSYEELLCGNPLDAFKHHFSKVDPLSGKVINQEEKPAEDETATKVEETVNREQVNVDEVFNDTNSMKSKQEDKENKQQEPEPVQEKLAENHDSNYEDLFDLFEYKVEGYEENVQETGLIERIAGKEIKENNPKVDEDTWLLQDGDKMKTSMEHFQNLSELEEDFIQDKLREIKELLIMFGIPWVDSPAEAEAQCSYLELIGLVDGVVTDDSDAFLFGANHVYRNIFDKGDYVYSYPLKYIENELGLDRSKLILLSLFLGSDYTLGIRGVDIVNAMEIVRAFDTPEALLRFKAWAELPDVLMEDASMHYKNIPVKELEYKLYHRNFKKHWELPDTFPDKRVIEAYEKPLVDLSQEIFQWGTPDVEKLAELCRSRFKWDDERTNNTLEPLKMAVRERTGQNFFREDKIAVINSKRINQAIKALKTKEFIDEDVPTEYTEDLGDEVGKTEPEKPEK